MTTSFLLAVSLAFLGCVVVPEAEHEGEVVIRAAKTKSGFMVVTSSDGKVSVRSGLHRLIPLLPLVLSPATMDLCQLRWTECPEMLSQIPPASVPLEKIRGRAPPFTGVC